MQVRHTIEALTLEQIEELIAHYHKRWPATGYGTSTGTISYRHGDDVWVCTMTREDSCE